MPLLIFFIIYMYFVRNDELKMSNQPILVTSNSNGELKGTQKAI